MRQRVIPGPRRDRIKARAGFRVCRDDRRVRDDGRSLIRYGSGDGSAIALSGGRRAEQQGDQKFRKRSVSHHACLLEQLQIRICVVNILWRYPAPVRRENQEEIILRSESLSLLSIVPKTATSQIIHSRAFRHPHGLLRRALPRTSSHTWVSCDETLFRGDPPARRPWGPRTNRPDSNTLPCRQPGSPIDSALVMLTRSNPSGTL